MCIVIAFGEKQRLEHVAYSPGTCGGGAYWELVVLNRTPLEGVYIFSKIVTPTCLFPLKKLCFVKTMIKSFETSDKGYQKCHASRIVCQSVCDFDFIHQFDRCTNMCSPVQLFLFIPQRAHLLSHALNCIYYIKDILILCSQDIFVLHCTLVEGDSRGYP